MADLTRLQSQLLNSGLQQKDFPLYQVISQLISKLNDIAQDLADLTDPSSSGSAFGQTFATIDNEKSTLPNSKRLMPHSGVTMMTNGDRTFLGSSPIPMDVEEVYNESFLMLPATQIPSSGVKAVSNVPVMFPEEFEYFEPSPLYTLSNINSIPEIAIINGTILARIADNETITGNWDFTGSPFRIVRASPVFRIRDTAAAADEGNWSLLNLAGVFTFSAENDALSTVNTALLFTRSGASITSARIQTGAGVLRTIWDSNGLLDHRFALMFSAQVSVSLTADQTAWNPTGLGSSSFYFVVGPSAPRTIRGILAQSAGMIITIINTTANAVTFTHEDGAATAANRIWMPGGIALATQQFSTFTFYYDGVNSRWVLIAAN